MNETARAHLIRRGREAYARGERSFLPDDTTPQDEYGTTPEAGRVWLEGWLQAESEDAPPRKQQ